MDAVEQLGPQLVAYYVSVVAVGSYLIMNLFLVVLLQLFTVPDVTDADSEERAKKIREKHHRGSTVLIDARRSAQLREFSGFRRTSRHVSGVHPVS